MLLSYAKFIAFPRFLRLATLLFLLPLSGIPAQAQSNKPYVEILHLWAVDEERHALEAFATPVKDQGVLWQEHVTTTNFTGIKSILTERLSLGFPPTIVQWIGGREDVLALQKSGVFRQISDENFGNLELHRMQPKVAEIVGYEDGYIMLPIGIHLLNHVVYNQMILDEISSPVPRSWEEFLTAAKKAKELGYYGLTVSDERWQLRNLMHALLVSEFDVDSFKNLIIEFDESGFDPQQLTDTFKLLRKLQEYTNPNSTDLPWARVVKLTASNRAMATIIGDFSSPLFPKDGHFTCDLPPENEYYVWAFDAFALTQLSDPDALEGQRAVARAVANPENQATYILRKGGVPAYQGVDPARLDPCSRKSLEIWESPREGVFLTARAWAQNLNVIANATREFWVDRNMQPEQAMELVIAKLRALTQ